MTRRISYTKDAERDLREITAYTRKTWGDAQARKYLRALHNDIAALRETALRDPLFDEVLPGLRRLASGHHFVFYLAKEDRVLIARVKHERQDSSDLATDQARVRET